MSNKEYPIVENAESFEAALARVREAQKAFSTFTQEQVDAIFLAAATAANRARIPLAKMAVEETGMGVAEDKVIKNHFASEYIYNTYRNTKTCGVIEENKPSAQRRSPSLSELSARSFPPPTQPRPRSSRRLSALRPATVSSSALTPAQRRALSPLPRSFSRLPLRQALPRASSAGSTCPRSSSPTCSCRRATAFSRQAAPAWSRRLTPQASPLSA